MITIDDAAVKLGVTRNAVYHQIKVGNMQAKQVGGVWMIEKEELKRFVDSRYIRKDRSKPGELSIKKAAQMLNVPQQKIYYLIRQNSIKSHKRNGMLYIMKDSLSRHLT